MSLLNTYRKDINDLINQNKKDLIGIKINSQKEFIKTFEELLDALTHSNNLLKCVTSEATKPAIKRNEELIARVLKFKTE